MKLLYLHQYFTFPDSSGGTRSYDLSKEFIKNGIDVTIITTSSSIKNMNFKKRWTYIERESIKLWVLKSSYSQKMSIPKRVLSFLKYVILASIKIINIKADVVLATSTPLTVAIPAIWKKKVSKTPFIFEVRDVWPEGPIQQGYVKNKLLIKLLRKIEKYIYLQSSYVVALSIGMKNDILSRVKLEKIDVITNISELKRFKDISKKVDLNIDLSNKKTILYAGTLGPVNDIMYVAKLAEKMIKIDPDVLFLIFGNGSEKEKIISYCQEKNILNKNIVFKEPISKDSLPHLYSKISMGSSFVWDYKIKWDNSANKFFDSLAAGRPILINYYGWQAEVINKKKCGFVLPYHYNEQDIQNLAKYLNNNENLQEQCMNALLAAEEYSLENAVSKYVNILNSICVK